MAQQGSSVSSESFTFTTFNANHFATYENRKCICTKAKDGCNWIAAASSLPLSSANGYSFTIKCKSTPSAHDTVYMGIGVCSNFSSESTHISGSNKSILGESYFYNGRSDQPSIVGFPGNGNEIIYQTHISPLASGQFVSVSIDLKNGKLCLNKNNAKLSYLLDINPNKQFYPCVFCCSSEGNEFEFL